MRFKDIPGHKETKRHLTEIADSGRIPHALLLEGPEGIGKTALARAFVQYVDCNSRIDGDSCGQCPACRQHSALQHIDTVYSFPYKKKPAPHITYASDYQTEFIEFINESPFMDEVIWQSKLDSPASKPMIYVDEANRLIKRLSYAPQSSRFTTVILWQAERLREEAANKLLKLIEEPPGQAIIVMTSNSPMTILPTIYSRAQRIKVRPFTDDEIAQWMVENDGITPEDAAAIAPLARGSIVEAQKLLSKRDDSEVFLTYFIQLMRLAYQRDIGALKGWAQKLGSEKRDTIVDFFEYTSRMLRENFVANLHDASLNLMMPSENDFSRNFARFINEKNAVQLFDEVSQVIRDIRGNANAKLVLFDFAITVILLLKQ